MADHLRDICLTYLGSKNELLKAYPIDNQYYWLDCVFVFTTMCWSKCSSMYLIQNQ